MTTALSTIDVTYITQFLSPTANPVITGDATAGWTVTVSNTISQADLDVAVTKAQALTTSQTNATTLLSSALSALSTNAAFLALAAPTQAQSLSQVKALTRQMNALIKLATKDLMDTSGT